MVWVSWRGNLTECVHSGSKSDTMWRMDKLEAMNAFARVVVSGSFAEAARRLGLTRSAVSKAVAELEEVLGARLLDRTTRRVTPTEAGLAYYERCVAILAAVEETEIQVSRLHDEPRGVLRVNGPMSFGIRYLGDAVAEFLTRYPELKIELTLTDRFIDPLEEGVDVTVRIGDLGNSSLIARKLAPARRVLVAAPAYLAAHGSPADPAELGRHRCLTYGQTGAQNRWQLGSGERATSVAVMSCLCSNNGEVLLAAALGGNGIAELPTFIAGPDIAAGRLVVVLPEMSPPPLGIHAVYAPNRYLAAKTRAFIDFLSQRFGRAPAWDRFDAAA